MPGTLSAQMGRLGRQQQLGWKHDKADRARCLTPLRHASWDHWKPLCERILAQASWDQGKLLFVRTLAGPREAEASWLHGQPWQARTTENYFSSAS